MNYQTSPLEIYTQILDSELQHFFSTNPILIPRLPLTYLTCPILDTLNCSRLQLSDISLLVHSPSANWPLS